jgi:cardiolipin synthase
MDALKAARILENRPIPAELPSAQRPEGLRFAQLDRVKLRLRRHNKFALVVLIVLVIVGGLLAIAQDQETLRIESPHAAEDPLFPGYVSALLGGLASGGNSYTVLTNGDQIYPPMLDAVKRARRRISFETYIYS